MAASTSKSSERTGMATEIRPEARPIDRSNRWAAHRIVRRLATPPAAIYNWLAGPPVTGQERSRAQLAEVRNSQGRGTLVV